MKVIKQFYIHGNKTYYVGDNYKGKDFKDSEKYLEKEVVKPTKKRKK